MSENSIVNSAGSSSINNVRNSNNRSEKIFSECTRCGRKEHYATDLKCPARNQNCQKCSKVGHFAVKCRTLKRNFNTEENGRLSYQHNYPNSKKSKINSISITSDELSVSKSESFIFNIREPDNM